MVQTISLILFKTNYFESRNVCCVDHNKTKFKRSKQCYDYFNSEFVKRETV